MTQSQPYIEKESEAPLQPKGRNVKVTLPEGHYRIASATPTEPFPAGQINHKSETYLEVSQHNPMGVIVPLASLLGVAIGIGGSLTMVVAYFYDQSEGLLFFGIALFGLLIAAYFARLFVGSGDRPDVIRFCRKSGKVYRMTAMLPGDALGALYTPTQKHYRLETFDWRRIRGEIIQGLTSSGRSVSVLWQLQLAVLDEADKEVIYRFPVPVAESPIAHRRIEMWELIGRYMTDGPDSIPPVLYAPAMHRRSFMQCIERYNPFLTAEYWPRHGDSWLVKGILFVIAIPSVFILAPTQWAIDRFYPKPDWSLAPAGEFDESLDDPHAQARIQAEREYEDYRRSSKAYRRKQNIKYLGPIFGLLAFWLVTRFG
jgi:hypothetical protein